MGYPSTPAGGVERKLILGSIIIQPSWLNRRFLSTVNNPDRVLLSQGFYSGFAAGHSIGYFFRGSIQIAFTRIFGMLMQSESLDWWISERLLKNKIRAQGALKYHSCPLLSDQKHSGILTLDNKGLST
jgi:hypothetical protein